MKTLFNILAVAILSLSFASTGFAAHDTQEDSRGRKFDLEGTWMLAVERPDAPPFLSLHTYTAKGGMVGTNTSGTTGPTHGSWVRTGNRRFTVTFSAFRFDAACQYIGTNRVSLNIRFVGPHEFRSQHLVEIFDVDGNLIQTRYDAGVATRLPIVHFSEQR